jgi:hypothetical protein
MEMHAISKQASMSSGCIVGYSAVTLCLTAPVNREAEVRLAS